MSKVAFITGASSGLGRFLAHAFAQAEYALVVTGRNEERLASLASSLPPSISCKIIVADLTEPAGFERVRSELSTIPISVFVNNAAINPELLHGSPAQEIEDINAILSANTSTAIALTSVAHANLVTRSGGTILSLNSVAGRTGSSHEPLYAASKFGLRGFSESVKDVWWKEGVRLIDVYSGAIATGMSAQRSDVGGLIDPEELAMYLVTLCETKSFFVRDITVQKIRPSV